MTREWRIGTSSRTSALLTMCLFALSGCMGTIVSETFSDVGIEFDPACVAAVEAAAAIDPMQDTPDDLDEAIAVCPSLADVESLSELFPAAFDGADVRGFVRNRCTSNEDLAESAVCADVDQ